MSKRRSRLKQLSPVFHLLVVGCVLAAPIGCAWATPTGLNNIPTADTTPRGVLVLQEINSLGHDRPTTFTVGAKYGATRNIEVGVDDQFAGPGSTAAVFQAKYRFLRNDSRLSAAVGVANLGEGARVGDPAFYLALKRNLGSSVRGHAGFLAQGSDHAAFAGLDGDVGKSGWTWRTDAIQTRHGHEWLGSVGAIGPLTKRTLLESWVSFPTQTGAHPTYILKFDYVIGK
jgi:hypothetical protein